MNSKSAKGLLKHIDFVLIDIVCLQISFVFAYWIFREFSNPYDNDTYQYQAVVLMASQLIFIVIGGGYSGILRRGKFDELGFVLRQMVYTLIISLSFLFIVHQTGIVSRLQYGGTSVVFVLLDWLFRLANKFRVRKSNVRARSLMVITMREVLPEVMSKIVKDPRCIISGIFLLDDVKDMNHYEGIPVYSFGNEHMEKFIKQWVDEVLIITPEGGKYHKKLSTFTEGLINSGISVSFTLSIPVGGNWTFLQLKKIGDQKVFTTSLRSSSARDEMIKRAMDIVVSIIGCVFTFLIMIILGPVILVKSPGPLFFVQERIGKNGKPFRMFKFRTMYLDAEEKRAALVQKNKISDGMMFKMDDDPRIIGSEKKDRKGRPCGIGNIMRKYSLDEFPQFFNVLRGDMSIVGWRPCMVSEWEKYHLKDRIRASMKPGITGLWQVSGRSNVIDFDEVVRFDREYLENWSIGLDIKIILKTIWVVVCGKGAM